MILIVGLSWPVHAEIISLQDQHLLESSQMLLVYAPHISCFVFPLTRRGKGIGYEPVQRWEIKDWDHNLVKYISLYNLCRSHNYISLNITVWTEVTIIAWFQALKVSVIIEFRVSTAIPPYPPRQCWCSPRTSSRPSPCRSGAPRAWSGSCQEVDKCKWPDN